MARAGHPPITPTVTRLKPAEPSTNLMHQANLTSMRPHHDPTSSAGADELPACPRRVPTRSSMHPHTHGRPRAAQACCARADEPPQRPSSTHPPTMSHANYPAAWQFVPDPPPPHPTSVSTIHTCRGAEGAREGTLHTSGTDSLRARRPRAGLTCLDKSDTKAPLAPTTPMTPKRSLELTTPTPLTQNRSELTTSDSTRPVHQSSGTSNT